MRAKILAELLNRVDCLVPLLWGQWVFHGTRSEHQLALVLAGELRQIGLSQNNSALQMLGSQSTGITHFFLGDFVKAHELFEQSYDTSGADLSVLPQTDDYAANRLVGYFGMTLMFTGYLDQGRAKFQDAVFEARRQQHTHTLAALLGYSCWGVWSTGSAREVERAAREVLSLSEEHGFLLWLAWGNVHLGWSIAALGQPQMGISLIEKGLSMYRATGAVVSTPWALTILAGVYARAGHTTEAADYLAEAASILDTTEDRYSEAELHRVRGDLMNSIGDESAAERGYRQALEVANKQSARTFELRAATSLARLWRDQGKLIEAGNLLAPVYGWFTEGFDTPVLQEAKALLDELAQ
jgi:tetratricopeptide (TPR) repeat protein